MIFFYFPPPSGAFFDRGIYFPRASLFVAGFSHVIEEYLLFICLWCRRIWLGGWEVVRWVR